MICHTLQIIVAGKIIQNRQYVMTGVRFAIQVFFVISVPQEAFDCQIIRFKRVKLD